MPTVKVYVTAYILGFALPDEVVEVQLGDDLVIWNVPPTPPVLGWSHRQHFLELGYIVEGGHNSLVKEKLNLDHALLPARLYSVGDLQAFIIRHSKAISMDYSERESLFMKPGFPGAMGGIVKGWGYTSLSKEQLQNIQKEYPRIRKSKNKRLEVATNRFSSSYERNSATDRAIDLIIALDSLLSEGADSIRYKVAMRAAMLLENKGKEREKTFNRIYAAYGHRNNVVHGNTSPSKRECAYEWFEKNVYQLLDDVKRILLYFIQRDLNGETIESGWIEKHLFEKGILGLDLPEGS